MRITTRRRADLRPLDPIQRHTAAEREALRRSMAAGWIAPAIVSAAGEIIDGGARIAVAPDPEAIPCVEVDVPQDDARAMRYRLHATRGQIVASAVLRMVGDLAIDGERGPTELARLLGIRAGEARTLLQAAVEFRTRGEPGEGDGEWSEAWETAAG